MNNLVELTRQQQENFIANCEINGEIVNETMKKNNRSFNFTDFYYLFSRSFKSSIIRGWKYEFIKAICLLAGVLLTIIIYPNLIGSDPSCPIHVLNEFNLSEITEQIYNSINGKRSNGELNVSYLIELFFYFGYVYVVFLTLVFTNEIKVSLYNQMLNLIMLCAHNLDIFK